MAEVKLRDYERAVETFTEVQALEPTSREVETARQRLHESRTGGYDWMSVYASYLQKPGEPPVPRLKAADFVGPVRVEKIDGKGYGLVATRAIRAGELVLANRALAAAENGEFCKAVCDRFRFSAHARKC